MSFVSQLTTGHTRKNPISSLSRSEDTAITQHAPAREFTLCIRPNQYVHSSTCPQPPPPESQS